LTQQEEKPLPPSKVLVVDDNPQNLELLMAYMEGLDNVTVSGAADGEEAMRRVRSEDPPDLILLDVMMPKMSGFEVCRQIKSNPRTRNIQIIMVTALNEVGDHERAADAGTDEFLTKPVNRAELVTRVKNLLQLHHLKLELEQNTSLNPEKSSGQSPQNS
jgi:CheY-like chemotaxis protein